VKLRRNAPRNPFLLAKLMALGLHAGSFVIKCKPVLAFILLMSIGLSAGARSFDETPETLAKANLFSQEFVSHTSGWLVERIDTLILNCFSVTDADRRTILIENIGLRLDEFMASPESEIFLNEISASSYIVLHRKVLQLFVDNPERTRRIELSMDEAWPASPSLNLDTVRKYLYLIGLHSENPSRDWGINSKKMLQNFKVKHFEALDTPVEKVALLFFNIVIGQTIHGSSTLSKAEVAGFRELLGIIHPLTPYRLTSICNFFLKNM
jgi:hypothetical protein